MQSDEGPIEITRQKMLWPVGSTVLLIVLGRVMSTVGHAVAQLVEAVRYKLEAAGSIPDGVTAIFH